MKLGAPRRLILLAGLLPLLPLPAPAGEPSSRKPQRPRVDMSAIPADEAAERADLKKLNGARRATSDSPDGSATQPGGQAFQVFRTNHFSILHDVSEADVKAFSTSIEKTYRSNLNYTLTLGIEPRRPAHKLIIYYFREHAAYDAYSRALGKGERPQSNPGVFFPDMNRSMFYNFQDQESVKRLREQAEAKIKNLQDRLKGKVTAEEREKIGREILQAKSQANFSATAGGGQNEETVQHEVTHHVLWNVGLHNAKEGNFLANPRWFVEGTAMMFETAGEGKASNIGAVNRGRLREFQHFERQGRLFDVRDFISRPDFFAAGGDAPFIAYAQSWALVHYLNRTKRKKIKTYVELINQRPPGFETTPAKEIAAFEKAFGRLDARWVRQWRAWMRNVR
jgi:hypothetical protein